MKPVLLPSLVAAALLVAAGACDGQDEASGPDARPVDAARLDASGTPDSGGAADGPAGPDGSPGAADSAVADVPHGGPADARPGAPAPLTWMRESTLVLGRDIFGTGADDVWIVGDFGEAWHSRGDGTWQSRRVDTPYKLTGVWGSAPNDVYASVEANIVVRWNGQGWEKQFEGLAIGTVFDTIWGASASAIYVAGPSMYRSAGDGKWVGEKYPLTVGPFTDLWASGPTDVWALGGGGVQRSKGDGAWRVEQTGGIEHAREAIWGSGPNDVYAVGGVLARTKGDGVWRQEVLPERLEGEHFLSVWGSGPNDVFVGTDRGRVFRSRGDGQWFAEPVDPRFPKMFVDGIWGSGPNNVYVMSPMGVYRGR